MSHPLRIGLAAWAALIAWQLLWYAWLFPPQQLPLALVLALTAIPLLLPALALRQPRRALLLVGMLCLFYFCHGVAECWSTPAERQAAWIEIVLTLIVIGSLGATVRRRNKIQNGTN